MSLRKLKASELPEYRAAKLAEQGHICPLTGWHISEQDAAADHCHVTGMHRAVIHKWANSTLGRIENWARRMGGGLSAPEVLRRCAAYIEHFDRNPSYLIHHTHKTPEERKEAARLKRNKTARERRAVKKTEAQ
jgi:hypothetical protein